MKLIIVPILLLCLSSFIGCGRDKGIELSAKTKDIKVEAYQYAFSPDPIVVKKGDIVKLYIASRDVTHGFYIKEYGINLTIEKGKIKEIKFLADKEGQFDITCSVFCGPGHSKMKGRLVVEK